MKIFTNEKFIEVAKYEKLDTPDKKGENDSIANVIIKNKISMKTFYIQSERYELLLKLFSNISYLSFFTNIKSV